MQSDHALVLPPPQPAQPVVLPQPVRQPAPNTQQPIPGSNFQNVYLIPMQSAPFAEGYAHKQALFLGWAQIIIGILCVIFQCAAIGTKVMVFFVSQGIWCGLFFILTGTFGVVSAKKKTKSMVVTFMVLSIVAATIFFTSALIPAAVGLGLTDDGYMYSDYTYRWNEETQSEERIYRPEAARDRQTSYALNAILLILAIVELIIAIWSAAVCCGGLCCRKKTGFMGNIQYTAGAYPQVIMIDQQGAQIPMQMLPQGMPGQQAYTPPPMYDAGGPPMYEQNDTLPFKA